MERTKERDNISIYEYTAMTDIWKKMDSVSGYWQNMKALNGRFMLKIRFLQVAESGAGTSTPRIFRI